MLDQSNSAEFSQPNPLLSFEYRGRNVSIPIATSLTNLKEFVHEKTIPSFHELEKQPLEEGEESGVALTLYRYPSFSFAETEPEKAVESVRALKNMGLPVAKRYIKLDNYEPTRKDLITNRKQDPETYFEVGDLMESTFILGPILAHKPETNLPPQLFDESAEIRATTAEINGCIAVDGKLILETLGNDENRKIVTNVDLVKFVEMMSTPISYELTHPPRQTFSVQKK